MVLSYTTNVKNHHHVTDVEYLKWTTQFIPATGQTI